MAYARYHVNGVQVPSVTTISGRFADKGGLLFWANQVGLGRRDCDDQVACTLCGRKPGKTKDEAMRTAASVGSYAHALIDERVKGTPVDFREFSHLTEHQLELAKACMGAFDRWWSSNNVEVMETELPLVSEKHMFGGRLDMLGWANGLFALVDWKSSRGIYPDYLTQLAGYLILVEENGLPDVEEVHIVRVSKEQAAFEHRMFPRASFQPAIDFFFKAREMYSLERDLNKILK